MLSLVASQAWLQLRNAIFDGTVSSFDEQDEIISNFRGITSTERLALAELADELFMQLNNREHTSIARAFEVDDCEFYRVIDVKNGRAVFSTYNWTEALTVADQIEEWSK